MKDEKGFTLIEAIVVIAVLAILAGTLVPLAIKNIEDSKLSAAQADVKAIVAAITNLNKDTSRYPHQPDSGDYLTNHLYVLYSGESISEPAYEFAGGGTSGFTGRREPMAHHLIRNKPNGTGTEYANWKGPYLAADRYDQWGMSYYITVIGYAHCISNYAWPYVWVISAGPDQKLTTSSHGSSNGMLSGDDIGLLIHQGDTSFPCDPD